MSTIEVNTTFTVAAGDSLNFTNETGFFLEEVLPTPPPVLTIDGTVQVALASVAPGAFAQITGIQIGDSGFYKSTVTIDAGGVFRVSSAVAGAAVYGFSSGSWSPALVNRGAFLVSSLGDATGFTTYDAGDKLVFDNENIFDVTTTTGVAVGVRMGNGGHFLNTGDMEITGGRSATGVMASAHEESFDNRGTIHVQSQTPGAAVAVAWGFGLYFGAWSNAGTIQGDVALQASIYSASPSSVLNYTNTGTMIGAVNLTSNADHFISSGQLTGVVNLGAGDDVFDTVLNNIPGTINGAVYGGDGADYIRGGAGAAALNGDAGADTLIGGSGQETLSGGDGDDVIFATYNNVRADGGAGNDVIHLDGEFVGSPVQIRELDGGDGDDQFIVYMFPNQTAAIDGGAGHNSLEMHYFGSNTAVIKVGLDGAGAPGGWNVSQVQTVTVLGHIANVVAGSASETITAPGTILGGAGDDRLTGSDPQAAVPEQFLMMLTGDDSIDGGGGSDTISGLSGHNYLRGGDGDDSVQGGSGFDDINGNKGADTIDGGAGGGDWLVGGQGDDLIFAHQADVVWGNLGNDTLHGGATADQVRGGQGDDSILGGSGNEFISGDRGNDTESGGGGADTFHGSQDAGIDRVLDFNPAEGDRVMLDPGTTYTLRQVGSDAVIDMGAINGQPNQMILVGVQLSSLRDGWIFGA